MYAIVDIAGQQFKVEKNQKVFVHRLDAEEGSKVDFDKILLVDDNGKVNVGTPTVANMVVSASVISHLKGDKVKVFKKKRRKGYKVLNGHRQYMTEILIEDIKAGKATKKAEAKAAAPKEEKPAAKTKAKAETAPKKEAAKPKTEAKKAAPKKAAPKKEVASKEAAPKKAATKKAADKDSNDKAE